MRALSTTTRWMCCLLCGALLVCAFLFPAAANELEKPEAVPAEGPDALNQDEPEQVQQEEESGGDGEDTDGEQPPAEAGESSEADNAEQTAPRIASNGSTTVSTAEELFDLLMQDPGGTVYAACDLYLDDSFYVFDITQPVTVDMGPHTLFLREMLIIGGPVHFTGSGTVIQMEGQWTDLQLDYHASIRAAGEGAVALRLSPDVSFESSFALLEAEGDNAVAIEVVAGASSSSDVFELSSAVISARGSGSVGIRSEVPLTLFLMSVQAEECSAEAPELTLINTWPEPMPTQVDDSIVMQLTPTDTFHRQVLYPGEEILANSMKYVYYDFYLDSEELTGWDNIWARLPAEWDISAVDYYYPGEYPLYIRPLPEYDSLFPPMDFPEAVSRATVMDVGVYILELHQESDDDQTVRMVFEMFSPLQDDDDVSVFYREEHEEDWTRVEDGRVSFENSLVTARSFAKREHIGIDYLFRVEVIRDGSRMISNDLPFVINDPGQTSSGSSSRSGGVYNDGDGEPPATLPLFESIGTADTPAEPTTTTTPGTLTAPATVALVPATALAAPRSGVPYNARELALLAEANPGMVPFSGDGMTLLLSAASLKALSLEAGELFQVDLTVEDSHSFSVRLRAGTRELGDLGGEPFALQLPAILADGLDAGLLACLHEEGEMARAERGGNTLVLIATHTGMYTLAERSAGLTEQAPAADPTEPVAIQSAPAVPAERAAPVFSLLPVVVGGAVMVLGAGWLWLRLRRGVR